MKLHLVKIEEGIGKGNVVFHAYIDKSKAEIKKQLDSLKNKRELKENRKRIQEENVKRKQELAGKKQEEQETAEAEFDDDKDSRATKTVA